MNTSPCSMYLCTCSFNVKNNGYCVVDEETECWYWYGQS